jgi:hypothetical protein
VLARGEPQVAGEDELGSGAMGASADRRDADDRGAGEQAASVEALRTRLHESGREIDVLAPGELERRTASAGIDVDEDLLALPEPPG